MGAYAIAQLRALAAKHLIIGDVRGLGLMLGVELLHPGTRERATDAAERVMYASLARGLSFKLTMGNILTLTPALTITEAEFDDAIAILDASFGDLRV